MTAGPEADPTGSDEAPPSRSERLSRDVLHAVMIDPKPWAEIQANRREVVRTTFGELDPQDEFEGMLASQMVIAHSIFLGTSWLSLDHERPERDRAYYLRQATRLMTLYRQSFNTLRQWRRERVRNAAYGLRRKVECPPAPEARNKNKPGQPALLRQADCARCAAQARANPDGGAVQEPMTSAEDFAALDLPITRNRKHWLMQSTSFALAQGP
jgi:hypothetical protein